VPRHLGYRPGIFTEESTAETRAAFAPAFPNRYWPTFGLAQRPFPFSRPLTFNVRFVPRSAASPRQTGPAGGSRAVGRGYINVALPIGPHRCDRNGYKASGEPKRENVHSLHCSLSSTHPLRSTYSRRWAGPCEPTTTPRTKARRPNACPTSRERSPRTPSAWKAAAAGWGSTAKSLETSERIGSTPVSAAWLGCAATKAARRCRPVPRPRAPPLRKTTSR
jgi:hypothetical protein